MSTSLSPVILHGRHVRLEPLAETHLAALGVQALDERIWRFMPLPQQEPSIAFSAWRDRVAAAAAQGNALIFAILSLEHGGPIGGTSMQDISFTNRSLEIGATWLSPHAWRTAVNTECKLLLLRHAFEELGCNRVQLKTDARNARSQAAIERLGAKKEGVLRRHLVLPDGHVRDSVLYSIIRDEWPAVRDQLHGALARHAASRTAPN